MKITEYQKAAKGTLPDLGDIDKNVQHMDMGIITEIGEITDPLKKKLAYGKPVDYVNIGEEIADCSWYIVNKCTICDIELEDFTEEEAFETLINKKKSEYFTLPEEEKEKMVTAYIVFVLHGMIFATGRLADPQDALKMLCIICTILGIVYFEQLDKNIRKLKARFPDKFDADRAINRDLAAERRELEK